MHQAALDNSFKLPCKKDGDSRHYLLQCYDCGHLMDIEDVVDNFKGTCNGVHYICSSCGGLAEFVAADTLTDDILGDGNFKF